MMKKERAPLPLNVCSHSATTVPMAIEYWIDTSAIHVKTTNVCIWTQIYLYCIEFMSQILSIESKNYTLNLSKWSQLLLWHIVPLKWRWQQQQSLSIDHRMKILSANFRIPKKYGWSYPHFNQNEKKTNLLRLSLTSSLFCSCSLYERCNEVELGKKMVSCSISSLDQINYTLIAIRCQFKR